MSGLNYLDQISDATVHDSLGNPQGLHFEPGIWAHVPATTNPLEPKTVIRMGSIPHGTVILAQGLADGVATSGPPTIGPVSITPFVEGSPTKLFPFPNETTLANNSTFTTPAANRPKVAQAMVDDPNSVLNSALKGVTVNQQVQFSVSSGATPTPGGGTANTAFLSGTPGTVVDGNANARAAVVTANLWILDVTTAAGLHEAWLQYSQTVFLNFAGLTWPHVTVATLVRQP